MRYALLPLFVPLVLLGQNSQITGRVSDPTGAVIPNAQVTLTNEGTGVKWNAVSNAVGYYTIPLLEPGSYRIRVEGSGFKPVVRSAVRLQVEQVARIDFTMELGQVSETVEITAEAPLVESETSSVGQVVNNKTIVEMPLNGRNAWHLVQLAAATVFVGGIGDASEIPVASMAGGRAFSQMLWIDGTTANKSGLARSMAELGPMVDSVQEFKVITNNYAAEYGRSVGGVFSAVTKSGTNAFHGTAFEFLRNDAVDARNFFSLSKPPLRYNQFGGTLGGPIRRNKTHFFVGEEVTKVTMGQSILQTVPTAIQKRGDFTGLVDATGAALQLYNPFTTRPNPAGGNTRVRDPFPDNIIPASLFDPVGVKAISYYPNPNVTGSRGGANSFNINIAPQRLQLHTSIRIDHTLTERDKVFFRYIDQYNDAPQSPNFPEPAASGAGGNTRSVNNTAQTASGSWIRTLTPSLISDFKFSWLKQKRDVLHASIGGNWPSKLGLKNVPEKAFPVFRPQGYTLLGGPNAFREQRGPTYQAIETLTYIRGNHNFKTGFEYRWNGQTDEFDTIPSGDMTFAQQGTGLQGNARTGNGLASMLLGFATQASLRDQLPLLSSAYYLGAYLQDDWKVTPNLTLNLGVRWDFETGPIAPDDTWNGFDMAAIHPIAKAPGVITFAGVDGVPRRLVNSDWNNVGPRFGFAWRPMGNAKTVVRGGWGLFFGNRNDIGYGSDAHQGFSLDLLYVSPDQNQTPAFLLKDGYPAYVIPGKESRNASFGLGTPVTYYERDRATPYAMQYNLGIQHEIRGILLEGQYIGNLGRKLTASNASINQIRPELLTGAGTSQSRRPYPQFSDVTMVAPNWGASSYHAFAMRVEKRYQNGLQFLFNYTFSKFLDNVDSIANGDFGGTPGVGYQDFYNRRLDKALSPNDITHNVTFSTVWDVPFGPGRRWLTHGVASQVIGGWQLSALGSLHSGSPYGVVTQTNTCECFSTGPQRANILRDPALPPDQRSPERWFDITAFSQPDRFHFGSAARSVGRTPGFANYDLGLMKNFQLHERFRLQFRGELFNAFNHTNLANPNTNFGSGGFGSINASSPARIVQFGLKLYF
jgi:hypothetical protein